MNEHPNVAKIPRRKMIQFLRVKNLALVDSVELEFEGGFNVVTGETGAGKSILLGALAILAGNRVSKTVIGKGAESCEVEAAIAFDSPEKINLVLEKLSLPPCENGALVLRRSIHATKPGRISVNGSLATLAQLAELGEAWIDFHGPGEPQKLFNEKHQLELLDIFAGNSVALEEFSVKFAEWKNSLALIAALRTQEKMSPDEIAFVQSQLDVMNALDLSDEAITSLESDFAKMSHSQELESLLGAIDSALSGEEGVASAFPQLLKSAGEVSEILPEAKKLAERVNSLAIEAEDLRVEYSALLNRAEFDPEAASKLTERMNSWLELRRKYGPAAESVRAKRDALQNRLESQSDVEGKLLRAEKQAKEQEASLRKLAKNLHAKRLAGAKKLATEAGKNLTELGFKKADIFVQIRETDAISETGTSACSILFSANVGQDLLPLNKIASAGETARVMLALKAVLADADETPVLVFDEVDSNVGGEIAAQVARKLSAVSRGRQLFCITHLAQVASIGQSHFCVTKTQSGSKTKISIARLDGNSSAREDELARMIGDRSSASAHAHAKELLSAAKNYYTDN